MFPFSELLSHAELRSRRKVSVQTLEARRTPRQTRYGNLTLFPRVQNRLPMLVDDESQEPRVVASISNISTTGLGLIVNEHLPSGMEFDVQWPEGEFPTPLRFEVVHTQPISAGMYRTGARLIAGILPEEQTPTEFVRCDAEPEMPLLEAAVNTAAVNPAAVISNPEPVDSLTDSTMETETAPIHISGGILHFEPQKPSAQSTAAPAPPGTFKANNAFGFEKTETLDGVTTCGWERQIQMRREGDRLWVYIHSPGKKNGWGIYVDADKFESALTRIQQAGSSPFVSSMAA